MKKNDFIIMTAIINTLIGQGIDIKKHIPKDKVDKYIMLLETRYPKLEKDKSIQDELIKELEKYVKKIK